MTVWWSGKW